MNDTMTVDPSLFQALVIKAMEIYIQARNDREQMYDFWREVEVYGQYFDINIDTLHRVRTIVAYPVTRTDPEHATTDLLHWCNLFRIHLPKGQREWETVLIIDKLRQRRK